MRDRFVSIIGGSSADVQGLKKGDYIFSINTKNVLEEESNVILRILREGGSSVKIGVMRPKNIDANLCKYLYNHYSDCNITLSLMIL